MKYNCPIPFGIIRPPRIPGHWWSPISYKRLRHLSGAQHYELKLNGSRAKEKKQCLDLKEYTRIINRPKRHNWQPQSRKMRKYIKAMSSADPLCLGFDSGRDSQWVVNPISPAGVKERVENAVKYGVIKPYSAPFYTDLKKRLLELSAAATALMESQTVCYELEADRLRRIRNIWIQKQIDAEQRIKEKLLRSGLEIPDVKFANGCKINIISTDKSPEGRSLDQFIEEKDL